MASVEDGTILYLIADQILYPDMEQEESLAPGSETLNSPEPLGFPVADRTRRVFRPFSRMAGRSSVRGNC